MQEEFANIFSLLEIDAIGEILNISLGSSATAISNMVERRVMITTPSVEVLSFDKFQFKSLEPAVGVEITYTAGLQGNNIMLLKRRDIKAIVELLMQTEIPDEEFELNELNISAICEVMNQMMGASSTALAEFLGEPVNISTPVSFEITDVDEFKNKYFSVTDPMVVVRFQLSIENVIESEFMNVMSIQLAKRMISSFGLDSSGDAQPEPEPQIITPVPAAEPQAPPVATPQPEILQPAAPPQPVYSAPAASRMINTTPTSVSKPQYIDLGELGKSQASNLDLIMSVPLQLSVEIGRTKKPLKDILEFSQGSLVVLDKLAGENVDLFVNGQCVAKGDVVVVDDYFGVRITEIVQNTALPGI